VIVNLPNPVSVQWLRELIDMAVAARSSEFLVKRIERDAQLLLTRSDEQPAMCWLVLAFTAFLQGEREECVRCAKAAYQLAKSDPTVLNNAASLMCNIGEPGLAVGYARELRALRPCSSLHMINAARVLQTALHFEEAAEMLRIGLPRQALDKHEDLLLRIDEMAAVFRSANVGVDLRVALLESAIEAIRTEGSVIRRADPVHYPDRTMRYEFFIDESATQAADVSFAIAEALVERFDDAYPELITFVCRPLSSYVAGGGFIEEAA
jgi:hypothetical protein